MTALVIADTIGGRVSEASNDAVACGTLLSGADNTVLCPLPPGADAAGLEQGAKSILARNPAFAGYAPEMVGDLAAAQAEASGARYLVIPNSTLGMDICGRLSKALDFPVVANVIGVDVEAGRLFSEAYNGKLVAQIALPDRAILLVNGGAFAQQGAGPGDDTAEIAVAGENASFVSISEPKMTDVDIKAVPILLSIGRGVATKANLDQLQRLAHMLGAELSASRPVVDAGLVEKARQVGKSGETVQPELYIALGISGAPEHLQGMKNARTIVAINSDPGAPIFGVADIGVTADGMEVVEALLEGLGA